MPGPYKVFWALMKTRGLGTNYSVQSLDAKSGVMDLASKFSMVKIIGLIRISRNISTNIYEKVKRHVFRIQKVYVRFMNMELITN